MAGGCAEEYFYSIKGLFLSEKLSKDMEKYRISDGLWREEQILMRHCNQQTVIM